MIYYKYINYKTLSDYDVFRLQKNKKTIQYINLPFSFDIETTSTYCNGSKFATMYIWQSNIGGINVFGRTWEEFDDYIKILIDTLHITNDNRLICLVHNLAFEFQFIRRRLVWSEVFARHERKPMYALSDSGIEFRCTYILSGYSLSKLADNFTKTKKLKGDLDYNLVRNSKTPLTDTELNYCENDVQILCEYYYYLYDTYICNGWLPLTSTSVVRHYCRNQLKQCCKNRLTSHSNYRRAIRNCSITSPKLYNAIKCAYAGGYTHANEIYVDRVIHNLYAVDFKSSYPAVMFNDYYPISQFYYVSNPDNAIATKHIKTDCCLIHCIFYGLISNKDNTILSYSKAIRCINPLLDNGRVHSADIYECWITELDYDLVKEYYDCDCMEIIEMYCAFRGRLPIFLIKSLAKFYIDKSKLKGVEGKEIEYIISKQLLNSLYGMCVTDIVNREVTYNDEWNVDRSPNIATELLNNAKSYSTFLLYQWGVWVSAHARYNLLSCVAKMDSDVVYCDTDSIKFLNGEENWNIIEEYNNLCIEKNKKAIEYYQPEHPELFETIGVWDREHDISEFKTLGAKKYISDNIITVSGLNKQTASKWLKDNNINPMEYFKIGATFNADASGRQTATYIDEPTSALVTDYNGVTVEQNELTSVHLENTTYTLGISQDFLQYIEVMRDRKKEPF